MAKTVRFVDSNCVIGRRSTREPEAIYEIEDFLAELAFHGIDGALVYHAMAKEFEIHYGNERLLEECQGAPNLIPCWVVAAPGAGDTPTPEEWVAEMRERGVKGARMFPKTHNYDTDRVTCGDLFDALGDAGIPVFMDAGETTFPEIRRICEEHAALNMVLCNVSWGADRRLFPSLAVCPNLFVETCRYQGHNALDIVCERFGSERLVFGTGLPFMSPGAAKAQVNYAQIPFEEKSRIASGNLLRLLDADPPEAQATAAPDSIQTTVDAGCPLTEIDVVDAHAHIGFPGNMGLARHCLHEQDAEAMLASMETAGIDKAMISSWIGIHVDGRAGNELVAETVKQYPDRFIGYATLNPNYPDETEDELERCFEEYGMRGFKPYPPQHQYPLDGPNNAKILEYCDDHHLPILCHHGGNAKTSVTAQQVEKLSERYLNAKFIFGHSGASWDAARRTAAVAKRRNNVFMEITYTNVTFGSIEYMVREAGVERVIFGTDFPMRDPHPQLGWVAYAKLTEEEKRQILAGNINRILADARL